MTKDSSYFLASTYLADKLEWVPLKPICHTDQTPWHL
jgi:hypothetical protein